MNGEEMSDRLSQSQKKALIWLAENDHWRSAWTAQGRAYPRTPCRRL
jgi:hypothetical protein